jgi:ABC-type nickel/cobalt efflux system permease component RcnA
MPMETGLAAALTLGLLTGLRHAFEPDHVVAVSTLLHRELRVASAARVGAAWGAGHTATLAAAILIVSILRISIGEEHLPYLELPVGIVLVAIGLWALYGTLRSVRSLKGHEHDGLRHLHVGSARHPHGPGNRSLLRGFLLGSLHGFAGSGALLLLTAAVLPSPGLAVLYALLFGAGSTVGMVGVSCGLSVPLLATRSRPHAHHVLTGLSGSASVVLGVFILWTVA